MSQTFTEFVTLERLSCGNCGVPFAVPDYWLKERRDEGGAFTCPNGCSRIFKEPTVVALRKQLEEKSREVTAAKCETLREKQIREKAEADLAKHQRRTKNGVCPCCRRTFVKLANHISKKHPDFAKTQQGKLP